MKPCPNCQKENPFDSRFCAWCGASLEETVRSSSSAPVSSAPESAVSQTAADSPVVLPEQPSPAAAPTPMPPVMPAYPPVPPAPLSYPPPAGYPVGQPWDPRFAPRKTNSGLAVAAFVLSLLAFFCCAMGLFNVFLYIGIGLTIAAWATMKPGQGKGLAIAAIVLSAVALLASISITTEWFSEDYDGDYSTPYDERYDHYNDYDDLYDDWFYGGNDRI